MQPWATARDLARLYNVSPRTIARWASEDHWHKRGTHPTLYAIADADASHTKRHAGRRRAQLAQRLTKWQHDLHIVT